MGRFLNRDPIGHLGGLNLYEYSYSNPVSITDESGLGELGTLLAGVTADHNTVHVTEGQQAAIGFALGFVPVLGTGIGIAEFVASPSVLGAVGILPGGKLLGKLGKPLAKFGSSSSKNPYVRKALNKIRDKCTTAPDNLIDMIPKNLLNRFDGDGAHFFLTKAGLPQIWLGKKPLLVQLIEEVQHYEDYRKLGAKNLSKLMNLFEYEALTKIRVAQKLEGKINKWDKLYLAITAFGYK